MLLHLPHLLLQLLTLLVPSPLIIKMSFGKLYQPLKVGNMQLKHRIVLAPLTRLRADSQHVPLPHVKDYYSQRGVVPGTLLVAEATLIAEQAGGYENVPGIWSNAQIQAWKEVCSAKFRPVAKESR